MSREELLNAFENKKEQEIPVSFWHHYAKDEFVPANEHPEITGINVEGHAKYVDDVNPDFVKLMTDGYFQYDFQNVTDVHDLHSLIQLTNIPNDYWWLKGQRDLIKKQKNVIHGKYSFYNVFSPVTVLKWALVDETKEPLTNGDKRFADLYAQSPELLHDVLKKIAGDINKQVDAAIDAGADGIYYSTQSIQDDRADNKDFFDYIQKPADFAVINEINRKAPINILHVCGFDQAKNHLEWYTDYQLQIINWSTHVDGYTLGEGKKLFGDRVVLGGFGITEQDVLYSGTKQEIQKEAQRIVSEAGTKGVLIGADCTIKRDTPIEHIKWAQEAVHALTK